MMPKRISLKLSPSNSAPFEYEGKSYLRVSEVRNSACLGCAGKDDSKLCADNDCTNSIFIESGKIEDYILIAVLAKLT